jgi:hypothetical protein
MIIRNLARPRNATKTPMTLSETVDVLNLLNLFDRAQGQVLYTPFNDVTVSTVSESAGIHASPASLPWRA